MKSKKFVLAGLALLAAITMVLLPLAGCKNDSVPESTRYTVKFETAHGTAPADITVVSGAELTDKDLAIEPEVGDNIFEYWYDKDVDARKPVEEGYTVTKDVTLVAKWRDRGTVASVTFSPAGGTKFYFGKSIEVSLTSEDGATIQYHLGDGSWKDYDAGSKIQVTDDTTITTITAKATKDGLKPSDATTATYTVRQLEGITVTPSEGTVYRVGEEVVHKKDGEIEVTATYDDEEERTVTGTITSDTSTLTESAGVQTVTVRYSEGGIVVSGQFEIRVLPKKLTGYTSPNNTDDSWTYVEFGEWPQTIKADNVTVYEREGKQMGMFTYYLGDDDNYYVKHSDKYYKVEPIVWRVLTEDYKDPDGNSTNKALLLAESILTGGIPYYVDTKTRPITGAGTKNGEADTVYPNNWQYSTIRAWLNGSYEEKDTQNKTFTGKGFLQTAFTESARDLIADTTVDNSAASTTDAGNNLTQADGCSDTKDKIFLLSEEEATTLNSGFAAYDAYGKGNTRIRVTTDYAKATGANQSSTPGYGGWWWLRSPYYNSEDDARGIRGDGDAYNNFNVDNTDGGVVPALCVQLP